MKADSELIEWLLEQQITRYQISKATGITEMTLSRLTTGNSKIENLPLKTAAALTEYAEKIMKGREEMKIWERDTYYVAEEAFDHDLHKLSIYSNEDDLIGEIVPGSIEDMEEMKAELDAGADVHGWADGQGGEIEIPR